MSLYREYRPRSFSEIVGQKVVSSTLLAQLEKKTFTHAYLFSGPRGTGKTSTARVFAKALNCQQYSGSERGFGEPCNKCENCLSITNGAYLDVIEIDAASNRGIDEIRDLREKINLSPTVGKYKVYIIDEVHMLTNEAFNALLKTLEEPPSHAIFILATTELHKVPQTIQSRTQKFEFKQPAVEQILEKLSEINKKANFGTPSTSLETIAQLAGGSFRDAEVLYEKLVSVNSKAEPEEVEEILGVKASAANFDHLKKLWSKDTKGLIEWLLSERVDNYKVFTEVYFLEPLRDILLIKIGSLKKEQTKYTPEEFEQLTSLSSVSREKLTSWLKLFSEAFVAINDSPIPSLPLEVAIVEACEFKEENVNTLANDGTAEINEQSKDIGQKESKEAVGQMRKVEEPKTRLSKVSAFDKSLLDHWTDIVEKVKKHNNSLAIFLRSATPVGFEEDNTVLVEVSYRFHKDRLEEPKNSEILASVASEVLGRDVRIKGLVGEKKEKPKKPVSPLEEVDPVEIFGKLS